MSRTLLVAGLSASALHVAVLTAVGSWQPAGDPRAIAVEPLMFAVVDAIPEMQSAGIEQAPPQPRAEAIEPVEPLETIEPEAAAPVDEQFSEESDITAVTETRVDDDAPGAGAQAPIGTEAGEPAEPMLAEFRESVDSSVVAPERASPSPVNPVVHHLLTPPPHRLMSMLTPSLQRAPSSPPEPAAPAVAPSPAQQHGERIEPVLEHRPKPRYPAVARRRGYEGTVILRVEVLPDGGVGGVQVRRSSGHDVLDRQAERTIREEWRFKPGRVDGRSAALWIEIPIEFRLIDA